MKLYLASAAALLLGTSALAGGFGKNGAQPAGTSNLMPHGALVEKASGDGWQPVYADVKGPVTPTGAAPEKTLASDEFAYSDQPPEPIDATDPVATGDPAGTGAPVDTLDSTTALGETSTPAPVQTAALDLSPRPATQNYPACEPGPGDDSCIQLYEPGVRSALASWSGTTGGFAGDGAVQMAMGGPEGEPGLDDHLADATMTDGAAPVETAYADDAASASPVETAMTEPDPAIPAANGEPAYTGMGGPEMETGYPPCSGSASDDRCIQLYERGVTGEGN